jgi:hypothetical protein
MKRIKVYVLLIKYALIYFRIVSRYIFIWNPMIAGSDYTMEFIDRELANHYPKEWRKLMLIERLIRRIKL